MASIGISGSPTMETWMVDILFSQPGQAQAETPSAASIAAPAVSVASAARHTVASGTGQAITALQTGGADTSSAAASTASATASTASDSEYFDPLYMTVAQANATIASNNAMTSTQISSALYSGDGLRNIGLVGQQDTFATIIQRERNAAQIALNLAADPAAAAAAGLSPDSLREEAAYTNAYADSMQKAFDNHTLVIQKLSDVPGVNYTQVEKLLGDTPESQPYGDELIGGYDQEAMSKFMSQFKDGKQAGTPEVGGVRLLVTWTDDSLNAWA